MSSTSQRSANLSLSGHCLSYHAASSTFLITGGTLDSASGVPEEFCVLKVPRDNLHECTRYSAPHVQKRLSHAQVIFGNRLIIFGGWNGRKVLNDMWIGDVHRGDVTWRFLGDGASEEASVESSARVTPDQFIRFLSNVVRNSRQEPVQQNWPSPRSNMAFGALEHRQELVIYGGLGALVDQIYSELWIYSVGAQEWRIVKVTGTHTLKPSRSATMMTDEQNARIFLFGGCHQEYHSCSSRLYEISFDSQFRNATVVRLISAQPNVPAKRLFSAGFYLKRRNSLLILGGRDINKDLKHNDIWEFNLKSRRWTELLCVRSEESPTKQSSPKRHSNALPPLSGHAWCSVDDREIVVQGGNGLLKRYDEFHLWRVEPHSLFSDPEPPIHYVDVVVHTV